MTDTRPASSVRPTRRALLARAAAAPALALPAVALAASGEVPQMAPDPHPAWFAEWRASVDYLNPAFPR